MLNLPCPNCKTPLKFKETESTEMGDGFYYEYDINICPKCNKEYTSCHQYDLVERDNVILDEVKDVADL